MASEKTLERRLRDEVKKLGGMAIKFTSPGHAGVFDRIVIMPVNLLWFVEMKSTGKKLSPLQVVFEKQMAKLGVKTRVIDSDEKLNSFLAEVKYAMVQA